MAIELSEQDVAAHKTIVGDDTYVLTAGQRLQVRMGEAGEIETLLDEQVPVGKQWNGIVYIRITETDAA